MKELEGEGLCVILISSEKRLSEDMVSKAFDANDDGAGVAWREDEQVHWKKGLGLEMVTELCNTLPLPYIAHFRISTVGGKRPALCHPFQIDIEASTALEGSTEGHVLFHNGHWGKWKDVMLEAVMRLPSKVPDGKWSDSRALAWAAANFGIGFLELVDDQRCAVFSPTVLEVFGTGWSFSDGIWASNRIFENRATFTQVGGDHHSYNKYQYGNYYKPTMCRDRNCTRRDLDDDGYCPDHQVKKKVEPVETVTVMSTAIGVETEAANVKAINNITETVKDVLKELSSLEGAPGSPGETPFVKALRLFKLGRISKKQFKKIKRAIDETELNRVVPQLFVTKH